MKQFLFLSIAALILVGCQENKTNSKNKSSEWISLFDGSSLDGWKAYNEESLPVGEKKLKFPWLHDTLTPIPR